MGLVTTRGFRDVLEIARMNRAHLYRLELPARAEPLVPRRRRLEITERVGRGRHRADPARARGAARASSPPSGPRGWRRWRCACSTPTRIRRTSRRSGRALEPHFRHVSVSSEINAEFREYERTCTTALNASVMPLAARYLGGLIAALGGGAGGPALRLLHSAGGMMSVAAAKARPLAMALSGPAAGVAAAAHVARALGWIARSPSTWAAPPPTCASSATARPRPPRSAGWPTTRCGCPWWRWNPSARAAARSRASTRSARSRWGRRARALSPGPACYGQGGTLATVTDANLVLGYLNPTRLYGGSIRIDPDRARSAVETVGRRLGLSTLEAAHGIVEVANASMLRALRLVSVQRGHDLRRFSLIAYGGAGPVHAGALARACGIGRVIVPAHSGAFSALGCLVSPLRYDAVQTHRARLDAWDGKLIEDRFRALEEQCLRPILEEGHPASAVTVQRSVDLRYVGTELRDRAAVASAIRPGCGPPSRRGIASSTATPPARASSA